MSSWFNPKTEKRRSPIEGRGLFARVAISAGEVVAVKGGAIMDRATFERALQAVHNRRQLPLTREEYELADEIERCSETALCVLQVVWDAMHEGPG